MQTTMKKNTERCIKSGHNETPTTREIAQTQNRKKDIGKRIWCAIHKELST